MFKKSSFSSFDRKERIEKLSDSHYDLLVIGGGATGSGIALDAASRGLKTALLEKGDFASGTSSRSTKLIHGGLRYLKQLDIGLVRESGTERAVVNKIAPHLCIPEKMLLPLVKNGTFGKLSTSVGLWIYDLLANVEKSDRRVMLTKTETLEKEPLLNASILQGAGFYAEYRTDDARLTIEIIKKASEYGAEAINYSEVTSFSYDDKGQVNGVFCKDLLNGHTFSVNASRIVSAGGPWVDKLRGFGRHAITKKLHLTKGIHIVVPFHRLPIQQSVYFDVPDGRMIFAIPRGKITYIGTTDTNFSGDMERIVATEADRDYLLQAVNHMFPNVSITQFDVLSSWSGLRALIHEEGKSPSELSRKDEIFEAKDGLISIAGGKLTGYRKMAEKIVDKIIGLRSDNRSLTHKRSITKTIQLTSKPLKSNEEVRQLISSLEQQCVSLNINPYYGWYLVTNYGNQAEIILEGVTAQNTDNNEVALALSELMFCLNNEMVQRGEDFFIRRTGRLYFDIQSIREIGEPVLAMMADKLNWSEARFLSEKSMLKTILNDATHFYKDENVVPVSYDPVTAPIQK